MRDEGLITLQRRPFRITVEVDAHAAWPISDLMERDFTAERPGVKFTGDITCIDAGEAFVPDTESR
jgi:hypothetical protein